MVFLKLPYWVSSVFLCVLMVSNLNAQEAEVVENDLIFENFKDWTYRCQKYEANSKGVNICELGQSVQVEQDGKPIEVLNISLSKADDKAGKVDWALIILTPLDVHLPSDFGLKLGARKPIVTRYRNCTSLGCWVVVPVTANVLAGLKKAREGAGFFRLTDGQVVKVVFSLQGFTQAYNKLTSQGAN
ncbi:hypothetical protein F9L33_10150 [Amylibacter sp. SFDW26]|uniref:invasion associated locus B family protein n=1 Tax=Amylibacter sp. SFDW26 TaxID=2652722 RepID=UPI0012622100|nr:invasion associated locus B family protein [Amylibacter sp. SFDW26]KAB7613726.1 hypothetical protein F9L33_10150 [Amylibacter sp. SFDW26]